MENQEVTICEKHKKKQKNLASIPANNFLCMNRYCPNSFVVLCQACKPQHRDHTLKLLSIEDVSFLVDRLLKTPFKQLQKLISESIEMMKKFKLIKEFKKKIDKLEEQIQKQVISLLDITQSLVGEYAQCKRAAHQAAERLFEIDRPEVFKQFKQISKECLAKMDYNFKKDKMQYGSLLLKELEDQKRKTTSICKHKIEEVKDYSMKIIQVILNTEDSDQQENEVIIQKKIYENLKEELFSFDIKIEEKEYYNEGFTKSTLETPKQIHKNEIGIQTNNDWMGVQEKKVKELKTRMQKMKDISQKTETDLKNKISLMQKEKEKVTKLKQKEKQSYEQKKKELLVFEKELRENRVKRLKKNEEKNELIEKMINIFQSKENK